MLALIPRDDIDGEIRWINADIEPAVRDAHDVAPTSTDGKLMLDAPIFNRPPFPFEQDFAEGDDVALFFSIATSTLGRWTVDLATGATKSERLWTGPSSCRRSTSASTARATGGAT